MYAKLLFAESCQAGVRQLPSCIQCFLSCHDFKSFLGRDIIEHGVAGRIAVNSVGLSVYEMY